MSNIKYLSNPCSWGSNYDKRNSFTYEGGKLLYHFCTSNCIKHKRFKSYVCINVIFFANDEFHAAEVLQRMLEFRIKKEKDYNYENVEDAKLILEHKDEWKFELAPTNQFYTVGWACNDTIL